MNKIIFLFSLLLISIQLFSQEEVKLKNGKTIIVNPNGTWNYKTGVSTDNSFTDPRDGHVYKTITIGTQTWMAENLAYKTSNGCWAYNNDPSYVTIYGYYYNWESAKKVCPLGWHLPSEAEWSVLVNYLGGIKEAASKLHDNSSKLWEGPCADGGNNSSGFSALPAKCCGPDGVVNQLGFDAMFWTSTDDWEKCAWYYILTMDFTGSSCELQRSNMGYKVNGCSIRCIKD